MSNYSFYIKEIHFILLYQFVSPMSFVPSVSLTNITQHYEGDLMEVCNNEKQIEQDVENDLKALRESLCDILSERERACVFDNVISFDDFVYFIYYHICSMLFLKNEKNISLYECCSDFYNSMPDDLKDPRLSNLSKKCKEKILEFKQDPSDPVCIYDIVGLPHGYSEQNRRFNRSISAMSEIHLPVPTSPQGFDGPLRAVIQYSSKDPQARRDGRPLTRVMIYQAISESLIKNAKCQFISTLSRPETSAKRMQNKYCEYYNIIQLLLMDVYNSDASDNAIDTYIAKAINLFELEVRYKLNTILSFAILLSNVNPDYFNPDRFISTSSISDGYRFRFSDLPPTFTDTIPYPNPYHPFYRGNTKPTLESMYISYASKVLNYPRSGMFPGPLLSYNAYNNKLVSSASYEEEQMEFKYYTILALSKYCEDHFQEFFKKSSYTFTYSDRKYAWFIHKHYNIFDWYHSQIEEDYPEQITKPVANLIRQEANKLLEWRRPKKHNNGM